MTTVSEMTWDKSTVFKSDASSATSFATLGGRLSNALVVGAKTVYLAEVSFKVSINPAPFSERSKVLRTPVCSTRSPMVGTTGLPVVVSQMVMPSGMSTVLIMWTTPLDAGSTSSTEAVVWAPVSTQPLPSLQPVILFLHCAVNVSPPAVAIVWPGLLGIQISVSS